MHVCVVVRQEQWHWVEREVTDNLIQTPEHSFGSKTSATKMVFQYLSIPLPATPLLINCFTALNDLNISSDEQESQQAGTAAEVFNALDRNSQPDKFLSCCTDAIGG